MGGFATAPLTLTSFGAAIVSTILAGSAEAWVARNHATYVTFTRSVTLPGVQLASGTYAFEVVAPSIVRVSSRDGKRTYLTTFTRDVVRPEGVPSDSVILLGEDPAGGPAPITTYYQRSEFVGHEFIYGK
jgi:hypothetical protein